MEEIKKEDALFSSLGGKGEQTSFESEVAKEVAKKKSPASRSRLKLPSFAVLKI